MATTKNISIRVSFFHQLKHSNHWRQSYSYPGLLLGCHPGFWFSCGVSVTS